MSAFFFLFVFFESGIGGIVIGFFGFWVLVLVFWLVLQLEQSAVCVC